MTGTEYRSKAKQLFDKARLESNPGIKLRLQSLALSYVDLAEQADKKVDYRFDHGTPAFLPERK